jgi:SAM-dependent methyltransferase
VLATDASREQLTQTVPHPRVVYREALADDSGAAAASMDLVTVAQALHWFDLDRFYAEAWRVLRPDGILAVWCYGAARVSPEIDAVLDWFYGARVGRHWPLERRHVEAGYRDLPFPFAEIAIGDWSMTAALDRRALIGYVGTWSAVARARAAEANDPLVDLATALAGPWPDAAEGEMRTVTWPLGIRVGRRGSEAPGRESAAPVG